MKQLYFCFWIVCSILAYQNIAQACFDGANNCSTRFTGTVNSKFCGGRELPRSATRNFHFDSSWELVCNSRADHFVRRPQKFDFNKWIDTKQVKPEAAFDYRRTLPLIEWSGNIPYQTIENWKWEECSYGTDAIECGTKQVCHDEVREDCDTDANGNRNCRSRTERVCETVACSCWYDHTRYESLHCSNENMSYTANFKRPDKSEWSISKDGENATFLPNKYDLLPGEIEDVQIFNNATTSTVLRPQTLVGNAWNHYDPQISGTGKGAQCRMHQPLSINVDIYTKGRDTTRASPNPFTIAENQFGEKLSPIDSWDEQQTEDGKTVKVKPLSIKLMDTSASVVSAIAEESRRTAERETLKDSLGEGHNSDGMNLAEALENEQSATDEGEDKAKGFFKNTIVRLELKKINKWWWPDSQTLNKKYSDDGESISPSFHVLSANQDVANSDMWKIDLRGPEIGGKGDFYRLQYLMPNRHYNLMLSVYQKGVPFYQSDCDSATKDLGWRCWRIARWVGLGIDEDDYFSKELLIPFDTEEGIDERPIFNLPIYPELRRSLPYFESDDIFRGIPYLRWLNPSTYFELWSSEKPVKKGK
jgi:hypothetical protein